MLNQIQKEIEELHEFFMQWFLGKIDKSALSRFTNTLSEDFELITPNGDKYSNSQITSLITNSYNSRKNMVIWTESHRIIAETSELIVAEYCELQREETITNRWSTVVFEKDISLKNGLRWLRVHETWKPD